MEYTIQNNDSLQVEEGLSDDDAGKDFTTLEAWKKARLVPKLPLDEKFNLIIQIRKASESITANISEGYGRYHYQEGIQFYRISRGSLYELKDHLISCKDFDLISHDCYEKGISLIEDTKVTLNGYIKYVIKRRDGM